jgi:hypothetical protein
VHEKLKTKAIGMSGIGKRIKERKLVIVDDIIRDLLK